MRRQSRTFLLTRLTTVRVTLGFLGEWLAGAARGRQNVLGVWMGTGIGGGLVLDGRPFTGSLGGAGEIGHMIVQPGGGEDTATSDARDEGQSERQGQGQHCSPRRTVALAS